MTVCNRLFGLVADIGGLGREAEQHQAAYVQKPNNRPRTGDGANVVRPFRKDKCVDGRASLNAPREIIARGDNRDSRNAVKGARLVSKNMNHLRSQWIRYTGGVQTLDHQWGPVQCGIFRRRNERIDAAAN